MVIRQGSTVLQRSKVPGGGDSIYMYNKGGDARREDETNLGVARAFFDP